MSEKFLARTKSFTRRSRALPENLTRTMNEHAERYVVEVARGIGDTTVAEDYQFDREQLFGRLARLTVEIGPGVGEQLVHAAANNPDEDYLAFEVWQPGIAKAVSRAVEAGVSNLRIVEADVQQAFPILFADGSVDEVWTFFPDPWRKTRHHKRRLVSAVFATEVARILKPGSLWRLATDWEDYAEQMREVLSASPDFALQEVPRWEGRVVTRFEERGRQAQRQTWDFTACRT